MSTALLILRIIGVLWTVAPELVDIFKKIMAAIPATPEAGNQTSAKVAIAAAESILPVLPAEHQALVTTALEDFKKTDEYAALMAGA